MMMEAGTRAADILTVEHRPGGKVPRERMAIFGPALNLIRRAAGKDSLRLRRKVAAWDDEFLASLIAA
jgi:hypothetical protein